MSAGMKEKILLVEDSLEFQKLVEASLGHRYTLVPVGSIQEARRTLAQSAEVALILLDVMLPDGSGFEFGGELQVHSEMSAIPLIFLTAKNSMTDKMVGFSLGADDYVTKPFDKFELLMRVDSKIAKSKKQRFQAENIQKGPIRMDTANMSAFIKVEGVEQRVEVTPIEFKLLLKLTQNSHKVLSRQALMESVWGNSVFIEDRSIDKHICSIRRKINPFGELIRTVSGVGYEFRS
jgi:DNA-binding response OmpR family regulator